MFFVFVFFKEQGLLPSTYVCFPEGDSRGRQPAAYAYVLSLKALQVIQDLMSVHDKHHDYNITEKLGSVQYSDISFNAVDLFQENRVLYEAVL